jgi:penicillin-binding protein 1A
MFALVAALEQGVPPEAVFAAPDRLVVARHDRGPAWRVANYEGHGFGRATLRTATALSINTVYARLLLRLGGGDADREPRAVVEAAARMGVGSPLRAVPSAVLGTGEVTRWRWPARTPPWPPGAAGGAVRGDPDHRARRPRPVPGQIRRRPGGQPGPWPRSSPTCSEGWSTAAPGPDRPARRRQDRHHPGPCRRLVRGLHPTLATAVWVGYPQGQVPMVPPRTGSPVSGGTWPAAIWSRFMREALAGVPTAGSRDPTCAWSS